MQALTAIRCSALPEAFLCPGSVRPASILIDPINDAATEGTAAHAVMAIVAGRDLQSTRDVDVEAIAREHDVDPDDLNRMAWRGLKAWRELRDAFRGARAEVSLVTHVAGVTLTGHVDLLGLYPELRLARLLDWKGGRVDRDYAAQVFGYSALVMLNHPEIDRVDASIVWLREGEIEPYVVTRADLGVWIEKLRSHVIAWDQVYHPGRQCEHCARSHDCEALIAQGRRDLALLSGGVLDELVDTIQLVDDEKIAEIHRRTQTMARFCDSFHNVVRYEVIRRGGEISAGPGRVLKIATVNHREVDPLKAWGLLQARMTDEELAQATKLRLGAIEDIIAEKAGKGRGAAAKRELAAALEAADALVVRRSDVLREVRK